MDIGIQMVRMRKAKGLSQEELAEAIDSSRVMIGKYEREEVVPSVEIAKKIADALEVTLDFLVDEKSLAAVDKSAYSKIEKGARAITVAELQKMARMFEMSVDHILNYEGGVPAEVVIEDQTATEQLKLIQQLPEEDRQTIFRLIDKMLTNQKFKDFFTKNIGDL